MGQVKFRRVLPEHDAQRRRGGELPDFIKDRSRSFGVIALVVLRILPHPKPQGDGVVHAPDQPGAKLGVGIHPRQVDQGSAGLGEQRHNAVE